MYQRVIRPYKGGTSRVKIVRPPGAISPSQYPGHRREYVFGLKMKCFYALGGICKRCGFNDHRALQIDHVNGKGTIERKNTRIGGGSWYHHVLKNIGSGYYQLLCANCNWIKRHENQETPRPGRRSERSSEFQLRLFEPNQKRGQ